ncbi:MAG TPA: hypothetical protein VFJ21_02375 [Mycobacteriales bacterium]|nr:hypothetical protein [Mycobacteriales bacterium]
MTDEAAVARDDDAALAAGKPPGAPPAGADLRSVLGVVFAAVGLGALICAFGPFFYPLGGEPLWLASTAFLLPIGAALLMWPAMRDAARPRLRGRDGAPTPPAS